MATLKGGVDNVKRLNATISSSGNLQASVTPQKTLKANMSKTVFPIDSELSHTSGNPVQNKVVTAALDKKANSFDIAKNTDIDKLFK